MSQKTLISASELHRRFLVDKEEDLVVLDVAFKADKSLDGYADIFKKGHIPGARFFDLHACVNSTPLVPRNIPEIYSFTKLIRSLGVGRNTEVVVYDHATPEAAARAWWTFRLIGHKKVFILNGGFRKWCEYGYDVTTEDIADVKSSDFQIQLDVDLICDMTDMFGIIQAGATQVLDTRPQVYFSGEQDHSAKVEGGHIPDSKNLPQKLFFRDDGTFKHSEEIRNVFNSAGVNLDKPIVCMCRTGMTACSLLAAAHSIGITDIPLYYGSWLEWAQTAGTARTRSFNSVDSE